MAVFLIMSYVLSVSLNVGMFIWFFLYEGYFKKRVFRGEKILYVKKGYKKKILKSRANSRLGAGEREIEK